MSREESIECRCGFDMLDFLPALVIVGIWWYFELLNFYRVIY